MLNFIMYQPTKTAWREKYKCMLSLCFVFDTYQSLLGGELNVTVDPNHRLSRRFHLGRQGLICGSYVAVSLGDEHFRAVRFKLCAQILDFLRHLRNDDVHVIVKRLCVPSN